MWPRRVARGAADGIHLGTSLGDFYKAPGHPVDRRRHLASLARAAQGLVLGGRKCANRWFLEKHGQIDEQAAWKKNFEVFHEPWRGPTISTFCF